MQPEDDITMINPLQQDNSLKENTIELFIIKGILSFFSLEIKICLSELDKYMSSCEEGHMTRVLSGLLSLKHTPAFTNSLLRSSEIIKQISNILFLSLVQHQDITPSVKQYLISSLVEKDAISGISYEESSSCGVILFLGLLITVLLLRDQKDSTNHSSNRKVCLFTTNLLKYSLSANRRELDALTAKLFYYHSLAYERANLLGPLINNLLTSFRSSCVRGDEICQAQLINLILRCYILTNDYEQASAFSSRTTFPERADNNQSARHLYYLGILFV